MGRLQPGNESLPHDSANWLGELADFSVLHPWLDACELFDSEKGNVDSTPRWTCRQCRRIENGPITHAYFYKATKFTLNYSSAIIIGNSRTGGLPCPDGPELGPINEHFPTRQKNWRRTTAPSECVTQFRNADSRPFSLLQDLRTAQYGNEAIKHYGALHLGMREVQEQKMVEQHALVANASAYIGDHPDLRDGISELRHLGAIPKFRGPSPVPFRVRGLRRNTSEQGFMASKLWNCVEEGKMPLCTPDGIPAGAEFFRAPTTTVPKKVPDRTAPSDKRPIWDRRRINLRCPKVDYWQLKTPTTGDLETKYCKLRTSFPGMPILGAERDIDASFTRCRPRPGSVVMFGTVVDVDNNRDATLVFLLSSAVWVFSLTRHLRSRC